ncbi:MAG: hypothetical protein RLW68_00885 [Devosia marina]|uniref:hypothetical protein n=1 Tax=Devosia marina TaxID=2683198 RepID=UPI0032EEED2C
MKRRGFLGLMGGALAAGPSMAKEAVAGLESLSVPGAMHVAPYIDIGTTETGIYPVDEKDSHGDWLRARLAEVTGTTEQQKRERLAQMTVRQLDPDLAVNRSFSLSAKVEMQKRRDLERDLAASKRYYTNELAEWLKRQALS